MFEFTTGSKQLVPFVADGFSGEFIDEDGCVVVAIRGGERIVLRDFGCPWYGSILMVGGCVSCEFLFSVGGAICHCPLWRTTTTITFFSFSRLGRHPHQGYHIVFFGFVGGTSGIFIASSHEEESDLESSFFVSVVSFFFDYDLSLSSLEDKLSEELN